MSVSRRGRALIYQTVFRPGEIRRLTFVDTAPFYEQGVTWFNSTHLTRASRAALGEYIAGVLPLPAVTWVGDSWGPGTADAYARACGAAVTDLSRPGRRLVDMLPAVRRARTDDVVLQFGVNDLVSGRDPCPDLLRAARLTSARLVVVGVPPIAGSAGLNERLREYQTAAGVHGT